MTGVQTCALPIFVRCCRLEKAFQVRFDDSHLRTIHNLTPCLLKGWGVLVTGDLGSGVLGSGVSGWGDLAMGDLGSGVLGSGVLATGDLGSGVLGSGVLGSGVLATGDLGLGDLGSGVVTDKLPCLPGATDQNQRHRGRAHVLPGHQVLLHFQCPVHQCPRQAIPG